jgi:hypothetical protein
MSDLCRCGCGEPRVYPVGLTRGEARLVRSLLIPFAAVSQAAADIVRKIGRARA